MSRITSRPSLGLLCAACLLPLFAVSCTQTLDESRQATGVKVGEVTPTSAIVWMRVTESESRRSDGIKRRGRPDKSQPELLNPTDLEGSAPGALGRARVRYSVSPDLAEARETPWTQVLDENDYTQHFRLEGLSPATTYHYSAETSSVDGAVLHKPLLGKFETAPMPTESAEVTFTVMTGQSYRDTDSPDGFRFYDAMAKLNPRFLVPTGDTVYYDSDDPAATSIALARYHWHRMYSLPSLLRFHLQFPAYWEKDDHDSYTNDDWPGMKDPNLLEFTWEQGLKVYAEQVPMSDKPYRRFRWGKHLEVWLTEGRDYRSPNTAPDGPEKTIWGAEQKKWLMDGLLESDADWKVLVSPTPIVGPDRDNKHDNHSNDNFQVEGDEFRQFIQKNLPNNFFVACGDRHWQYHSIDPETGVHEFSSGPVSDQHAGGTPGFDPKIHRFHRPLGGFLSVTVTPDGDSSRISFRFHSVDGNVEHEKSFPEAE